MSQDHAEVPASCRGCRIATVSAQYNVVRFWDVRGNLLATVQCKDYAEAEDLAALAARAHGCPNGAT